MPATLDAALGYAKRGWPVLPVHGIVNGRCTCGKRACSSAGKHPLTLNWQRGATTDAGVIRAWLAKWPQANVGVATGAASGVLGLDVDTAHGGEETLRDLEAVHGALPETPEVLTGGGGRHIYFAYPGGDLRNSAGQLGPGLDTRGQLGFVVAPPSLHASGHRYEWEIRLAPGDVLLHDPPPWLLDLLAAKPSAEGGERLDTGAVLAGVAEGGRDAQLFSLACKLRRSDVPRAAAETLVLEAAGNCSPAFPRADALAKVENAYTRYEPAAPPAPPKPKAAPVPPPTTTDDASAGAAPAVRHRTDMGNGRRLVDRHGIDLRFSYPQDSWFVWGSDRFKRDVSGEVERRAKDATLSIYDEIANAGDKGERRLMASHAMKSEAEARIRAMIKLARSEPGIAVQPAELDADPLLFNFLNGTLDLRTGDLRPHRREDLITKIAPVNYDPKANRKPWDRFLERVQPSDEVRAFLQRLVGSWMAGVLTDELFTFLHGPTNTGKSTFVGAVLEAFGDYGLTADAETFIRRKFTSGGPRNDIAKLAGSRLVVSNEVEQGRALAMALIKSLSSGDRQAHRFLNQESFEFKPGFAIVLVANQRPHVRAEDDAAWRRITEIPFTVQIPEGERDAKVKAELCDPARSGAAILSWAVEGFAAWQRDGLRVPAEVRDASVAYRQEMDDLSAFLDTRTVQGPGLTAIYGELWAAYKALCADSGDRPMRQKAFQDRLTLRGFPSAKKKQVRIREGIGLRLDGDSTAVPPAPAEEPEKPRLRLDGDSGDGRDSSSEVTKTSSASRGTTSKLPSPLSPLSPSDPDHCACGKQVERYSPEGMAYCADCDPGRGDS